MSTPSEYNNVEERMEFIMKESLPDSLHQLSQRHESFGQIVQYIEGNYVASQRNGQDKEAIEKEAKAYIARGLVNIVKDIETASSNIDQITAMQELSIDSLTSQVSLVHSRLHAMKSQHLLNTLDEMKLPNAMTDQSTGVPAVRDLSLATSTSSGESEPVKLKARPRVSMEERLSKLQNVGTN